MLTVRKNRIIVIGAGINGLVAANYLQRGGCDVLLLEKKPHVGGACTMERIVFPDGIAYPVPTGASLLGMMQDFIFEETGLSQRLQTFRSDHPRLVYFGEEQQPLLRCDSPAEYVEQARTHWHESGDLAGYLEDHERARQMLLGIYREASTPSWERAVEVLGSADAERWIAGSAHALIGHYLRADRTKIFECMPVTESGPVPLDAPGTAFTTVLMSGGSVFDGGWGFVNGGLWRLPLVLAEINRGLGVEILEGIEVRSVDPVARSVRFTQDGRERHETAAAVFFATDPITAARLTGDPQLEALTAAKRYVGSSGKVVLVFSEPVRWRGNPGHPRFDASVRYLYEPSTFAAFEASNTAVRERRTDYSPSYFQIYVEGAAMREMGWSEPFDYISVFFKDVGLGPRGRDRDDIRRDVERRILARLENPEALVGSVLFLPRDLQEIFFFPEGNIDHMELIGGQTFFARTFSAAPADTFYQFGSHTGVYYCGAGSFPCGSVAGTGGYLAARQFLRSSTPR